MQDLDKMKWRYYLYLSYAWWFAPQHAIGESKKNESSTKGAEQFPCS